MTATRSRYNDIENTENGNHKDYRYRAKEFFISIAFYAWRIQLSL
jgi:hypothetical protein